MIATGARVKVSGLAGVVTGEVLDARPLAELPKLKHAPPVEQVREILAESGATHLVVICHWLRDRRSKQQKQVAFVALTANGGASWFDLQGQALVIEELTQ